ncbi:hypothetical protein BDZ94DRAFT_1262444 [Collybia nuda]|uniref:Uncharacterized protein n=1 Tax=Collybia nuda TaxID=64659 RepID=A0A9P6CII0_9AGAR|nr:hypothetical protein BDZ94DRAFT_1262444 [Collybia nuda]
MLVLSSSCSPWLSAVVSACRGFYVEHVFNRCSPALTLRLGRFVLSVPCRAIQNSIVRSIALGSHFGAKIFFPDHGVRERSSRKTWVIPFGGSNLPAN